MRDIAEQEGSGSVTLADLIELSLLRAGDSLDPVDPSWEVDATITDDGNILIDGIQEFDSLDESASYLGVTNVSGFEFWALETDDGLLPLAELVQAPEAAGRA